MNEGNENKVNQLTNSLETNNWQDIRRGKFEEIEFDLICSKKTKLLKFYFLVKHFPLFDEETLSVWKNHYDAISEKIRKKRRSIFLFCLMADKITDEALTILSTFPFKRFSQLDSKPKMGIPYVIDFESNNIYGERCPASPIPVKKRCKEVVNYLVETYKITTGKTAPKAEIVKEKMATELKKWGIGLVGLGLLHFALRHILSSVWGVILIITGLLNLFINKRIMFLLNGFLIIIAGLSNMVVAAQLEINFIGFWVLILMQIAWGLREIQKYRKYKTS